MPKLMRVQGNVLTPDGFVAGTLTLDDAGRIAAVTGTSVTEAQAQDSGLPWVLPGFVDLHAHGAGGRDMMEGGDAAQVVCAMHSRHGTTALLGTTMTAPLPDLQRALTGLAPACQARPAGTARLLGVHLEGPYINDSKLGAQPAFARPLQAPELATLAALAPIKLITLAPEVAGNMDLIAALCAQGLRVQIGHSNGSYQDGVEALARGASGFTHLFNAMTGLHHREPGMAGAALAHAEYAEIIPDLIHVHAGAVRVALRCIPGLYCVSDSTSATGMPDGQYRLGSHAVYKCLGAVRLADGTLAGSALTLDQALRNLVQVLGLPLQEASARVSTHAANYLGLQDRGRLVPGAWADVVVMDAALKVQRVVVEGEEIDLN